MPARFIPGVLIMVLLFVLLAPSWAVAADRTWLGNGPDDNWSSAGNWLNGNKPNSGDRVIFDSNSQARLDNINDIAGLTGMEIKLANPAGDVTISHDPILSNTIELNPVDAAIDLSTAEKDLTLLHYLRLQGDTGYSVKAGRTLTLGSDVNGQFKETKRGEGVAVFADTHQSKVYDIVGGTLRLGRDDALPADSAVSVGAGAVFDLNGHNQTIGHLSGSGQVDLGSGDFTFGDATDTTFSGLIGGDGATGNVTKQGTGKVALTFGERGSRFTAGALNVNAGTLQIDSFWASSSVTVASGATLQGNGIIILAGVTVNSGGTLGPGGSAGQLICENGVTLKAGAYFDVELNGTTAVTDYDQLVVDEGLNLGSANLNVTLGFSPSSGDTFTIIDNPSLGAVTGTFNGLAEGATFTDGGTQFQITYVGGDGNDVVLTAQGQGPVIPTLSQWGMIILVFFLLISALFVLRNRVEKSQAV